MDRATRPDGAGRARPLDGLRIVVTRARDQAGGLSRPLRDLGAEIIETPMVDFGPPSDGGARLERAAREQGDYDWMVFTSPNGVRRFLEVGSVQRAGSVKRIGSLGATARTRVCCIGPGTAAAWAAAGGRVDLVPERSVGEALVEVFPAGPGRVLIARAEVGRAVVPEGLQAKGWEVDDVPAYRTVFPPPEPGMGGRVAAADVITFTSSSTVEASCAAFGLSGLPAVVAVIGPIAAATARTCGLSVQVEARVHTAAGLVTAIVEWSDNRSN